MSLTEVEIEALREALDDEHRAWATYTRVLEDFGPVRPFSNIREAEARHIRALEALFERYGLALPRNRWLDLAPQYRSIEDACRAGVQAELDNEQMYARLLASTERPDLRGVFLRLQGASRDRHLPAFRRCLGRGPGRGRGA